MIAPILSIFLCPVADNNFYCHEWTGYQCRKNAECRGGKSELRRAGWFVTRTSGDRWKVPQKIYRPTLSWLYKNSIGFIKFEWWYTPWYLYNELSAG